MLPDNTITKEFVKCKVCDGIGIDERSNKCHFCYGSGYFEKVVKIEYNYCDRKDVKLNGKR